MSRPRKWELTSIDPAELVLDKDLQMRLDLPDPAEYTELLQENDGEWCFNDPIRAFVIKGKHYVVDGFTRTRAALAAGLKTVPVEISHGQREDAIKVACGCNSGHGYRRTNRDKRRAVLMAITTFGAEIPVAKIASICAVSHTYVHNLKRSLDGGQGAAVEKATAEVAEQTASAMDDKPADLGTSVCTECGGEGLPVGERCKVCKNEQPGPKASQPSSQSGAKAHEPVDLVQEQTEKAKTTLGQLIRLLDELGHTEATKAAVESISKVLTSKRKRK